MGLLDGLDDAQREAVTSPAAPLCILAGAGSGKTRVLTRRIAYRINTGEADAARTMAVTFTRRAAAELKHRLHRLGVDHAIAVGTLHGLAYARLRQYWDDNHRPVPRIIDNSLRRLTDEDKRRRGVIDFDDMLVQFADTIRRDKAFADATRWFTRHVYVDEFQDITPVQFDAVMAWVGDRTDLCVVGDPNQSIYGWNGADPGLLASLPDRFPAIETLRLDANYRSSEPIVQAAAKVLGTTPPPTSGERGDALPTVTGHETEAHEATATARAIRLAHGPNTAWSHIAVLARTNGKLDAIADALRRAGIPFRVAGRVGLLARPAVKDALKAMTRWAPAIEEARHVRARAHDYVDPEDIAALHAIADMATEFDAIAPGGSAAAFADWLPTTRAGDGALGDADAVTLSTFHKAKGLEWPSVFVVGVNDGLVPLASGDPDEERRLLYVAMTRAERELHLSYTGARSPFLPDDLVQVSAPAPLDVRTRLIELRRLLAEAS